MKEEYRKLKREEKCAHRGKKCWVYEEQLKKMGK
jgi:hypothetical protein